MAKYVCPICGKSYENANDLAKCVSTDAVNIEKKEKAVTDAKLKTMRNEIETLYNTLKAKIKAYNELGAGKITASTSLNFSEANETETLRGKRTGASAIDEWSSDELKTLINNIFGF